MFLLLSTYKKANTLLTDDHNDGTSFSLLTREIPLDILVPRLEFLEQQFY